MTSTRYWLLDMGHLAREHLTNLIKGVEGVRPVPDDARGKAREPDKGAPCAVPQGWWGHALYRNEALCAFLEALLRAQEKAVHPVPGDVLGVQGHLAPTVSVCGCKPKGRDRTRCRKVRE